MSDVEGDDTPAVAAPVVVRNLFSRMIADFFADGEGEGAVWS